MSFGELIGALFGWLGGFVEWLFRWVPRYQIVKINERGVMYPRGKDAIELLPGLHWYVPNLTEVVRHHVSRCVLYVESLSLETNDEVPCRVQVGMVMTYHVVDILAYEVENFNADESMAEVAQGALQDIVTSKKWSELRGATEEGTRLGKQLTRRMERTLERFGVRIESCRPTDLTRLDAAHRVFGITNAINLGPATN